MIRNYKLLLLPFLFIIVIALNVQATTEKMYPQNDMTALTNDSDVIVIGQCTKKEAKWVGSHIETTVTLKAQEYLKGDMGSDVMITQPGGEMKTPLPITQVIPGMPFFAEGEKMVLFMKNPNTSKSNKTYSTVPRNTESKIYSSPYVVGLEQGKFTIVTDPKTNVEKVTRKYSTTSRFLPTSSSTQKTAVATKSGTATTAGEIVEPTDYSKCKSLSDFKKEIIEAKSKK